MEKGLLLGQSFLTTAKTGISRVDHIHELARNALRDTGIKPSQS